MGTRIYKLKLDRTGKCTSIDGKTFSCNSFKRKKPQYIIYVIRYDNEIIYVGEAERGVYRCIQGFTVKATQSVAYPWRSDADKKIKRSKYWS